MKSTEDHSGKINNVLIQRETCNGCGICMLVCPASVFIISNHKAGILNSGDMNCIECNSCTISCPTGAISIDYCLLSPDAGKKLGRSVISSNFANLLDMLHRHKITHQFKDATVELLKMRQILDTAQTAPIGFPPSAVHVLVINNSQQVAAFMEEVSVGIKGKKRFMARKLLKFIEGYGGSATDELVRGCNREVIDVYLEDFISKKKRFSFNAPLAMYFYGSADTHRTSIVNASAYAMLAGECLGLGTCVLGSYFTKVQNGKREKNFNEKWGVKFPSHRGVIVMFGYP